MIGGNLAFGIGWWGANQSGSSLGKSCRKILHEILAGKSCGKILQENLAWNGGGEKANLRKAVIGRNLAFGIGWWRANQSGSSLGKSCRKSLRENLVGIFCGKFLCENLAGKSCGKFLWEIVAGKCGKFLWENLVGNGGGVKANLRKTVIGGNLVFGIGWWGANQSGSSLGKSCRKILCENLAWNSCRKLLWEILAGNLAGKSCGKIMREILVGKCCEKFLQENVAGKCGRKFLHENLAWNGGGEKANLRKTVIGGNLAFGIGWWGANQSGSSLGKSCGKILWENVVRNSCRKMLRENVAGNSCGKILHEMEEGKKLI